MIERIIGRADEEIAFGGRRVFLSEIEQVLLETEGIEANYQVVAGDAVALKTAEISDLEGGISAALEKRLSIRMPVSCVAYAQLPRSEGKAKRLVT